MTNCNFIYQVTLIYAKNRYKEKYGFYSRYLTLFDKIFDEQIFKANAEDIHTILKTSLNHFPYEIDISTLLDLKPVQQVAKSNKDLYDLFVVAVEGNLESFEKWKATHSKFLSDNSIMFIDKRLIFLEINEERVLDRARLKSIFQEAQKNKVLKLSEVQKLLKVTNEINYRLKKPLVD